MTLPDLLATLDAQGVRLSARLVVDAPAGVMTPELRGVLAAHKVPILEKIVREMMWEKLSSQRWGPAAADPSTGIVVEQPDRGRMLVALQAAADDPYTIAEREAIQAEAETT